MISSATIHMRLTWNEAPLTVIREPGDESVFTPKIVLSFGHTHGEFKAMLTSKDADNLRKALDLVIDKSLCD